MNRKYRKKEIDKGWKRCEKGEREKREKEKMILNRREKRRYILCKKKILYLVFKGRI